MFQVRILQSKTKNDENFLFLENDNLRSKGFSEVEISRAKEIFESTSSSSQQVLPVLALPLQEMSTETESMDSTTMKKSPRRRPSKIPQLSSPALRKSLGDLGGKSHTTTVTVTCRKTSPSTPNLKSTSSITSFSNVRTRDTLSRRQSTQSQNDRSLRSHSESSKSLRSRDSMTSFRREPTPTKICAPTKMAASTATLKTAEPAKVRSYKLSFLGSWLKH